MNLFGWSILHLWLHGRRVLFFAVFKHKAMFKVWLRFPRISQASTRFGRIWAIQSDKTIDQKPSLSVEKKGWGSKICLSIQVGICRIYPKNHEPYCIKTPGKGPSPRSFCRHVSEKNGFHLGYVGYVVSFGRNTPVDVIPNCKLGQNVRG